MIDIEKFDFGFTAVDESELEAVQKTTTKLQTTSSKAEDLEEKLNKLYDDLYGLLFVESNPIPLKWMMYKMGLIENSIRLPLTELDETFHDTTLSELKKLKLI